MTGLIRTRRPDPTAGPDERTPVQDPPPSNPAPSLSVAAGAAGFQSVEVVRVVVDGTTAAATVTGVLHRYPRTVPVSLATARRLVTAGAPVRVGLVGTGRAG